MSSMRCPRCGAKTFVSDSRLIKEANQTWRRHKCQNPSCKCTFSTMEKIIEGSDYIPKGSDFETDVEILDKAYHAFGVYTGIPSIQKGVQHGNFEC